MIQFCLGISIDIMPSIHELFLRNIPYSAKNRWLLEINILFINSYNDHIMPIIPKINPFFIEIFFLSPSLNQHDYRHSSIYKYLQIIHSHIEMMFCIQTHQNRYFYHLEYGCSLFLICMHYLGQLHFAVLETVEHEDCLHGGWTASVVCCLAYIRQIYQGNNLCFCCQCKRVVAMSQGCILEIRIYIGCWHCQNPSHLSSKTCDNQQQKYQQLSFHFVLIIPTKFLLY